MEEGAVYVDFRKWPAKPHWHYCIFPLGEDAHGRWFCLPAGALIQRRPEPPLRHPRTTVVLIPSEQWWAASWNVPGGRYELYIDITTPARWAGNTVSMFDLDLDVVRDRHGVTRMLDEDEFAEHQRTFGYPPDIIDGARGSADALHAAVAQRREPFDRAGAAWLARACERSWPALDHWLDSRR
jgi:predicted RNA-binding protein associated with RNAse of E/G family